MPIATIAENDRKERFIATAGQTVFPYDFPIYAAADLQVRRERAGAITLLTLGTDYSVTGVQNQTGGNVVLTTGANADDIIVILSAMSTARAAQFVNGGDLAAAALEAELNRIRILFQQNARDGRNALLFPSTDPAMQDLPPIALRANRFLAFDANGQPIASTPIAGTVLDAVSRLGDNMIGRLGFLPGNAAFPGLTPNNDFTSGFFSAPGIIGVSVNGQEAEQFIPGGMRFQQPGTGATQRTARAKMRELITVQDFGAVGNNTTDDTAAIQAACAYAQSIGGGIVWLPATGAAYRIAGTIALGNGVVLMGSPAQNFAGATATVAQWTAAGSWLRPEHPNNPAVLLQGHGSAVIGVNFIHNQPLPSGGSWAPNTYGYCIRQEISHAKIRDVMIVNAFNGIELAYTSGSGGGTAVSWSNLIVSAFGTRLRTSNVNDTVHWSDIHCRNLYYSSDSRVVDYIRANTVGWDCGYTDNIMVDGLEFFEDNTAILLRNETCLGTTHSLYNATLENIQFNLPQRSVRCASTGVIATALWGSVVAQQGNAFGRTWSDRMFDLNSDGIDFAFSNLRVNDAGGEIFRLGNGAGGKLSIGQMDVLQYSSVSAAQLGFNLGASAKLRLGSYRLRRIGSAGARFGGGGLDLVTTDKDQACVFFGRFSESDIVLNGAWQDLSTDHLLRPGVSNMHQARLVGDMEVFTAVAAGTFSLRITNVSGAIVSGLSCATTGFRSFDTGWVDITEAEMTSLATLGRLQINGTNTARIRNGSIQLLLR